MIQFLFRKSQKTSQFTGTTDHPREEKSSKQWTNKLASLVDETHTTATTRSASQDKSRDRRLSDPELQSPHHLSALYHTSLRLEGPYFTPANPGYYNTVICLVAGTGISGAIAIAAAFGAQGPTKHEETHAIADAFAIPSPRYEERNPMESMRGHDQGEKPDRAGDERAADMSCQLPVPSGQAQTTWKRCIILWSVREAEYIKLPFFNEAANPGLEVRPHFTGKGHERLDMEGAVRGIVSESVSESESERGVGVGGEARGRGRTWVYLSGPNPFIETGEKACRELKGLGVEFYGARWS